MWVDLHVGVVWWLAWVEYGIEGCGIETCGYGIGARYVGVAWWTGYNLGGYGLGIGRAYGLNSGCGNMIWA